jgi:hypothetical protein
LLKHQISDQSSAEEEVRRTEDKWSRGEETEDKWSRGEEDRGQVEQR